MSDVTAILELEGTLADGSRHAAQALQSNLMRWENAPLFRPKLVVQLHAVFGLMTARLHLSLPLREMAYLRLFSAGA